MKSSAKSKECIDESLYDPITTTVVGPLLGTHGSQWPLHTTTRTAEPRGQITTGRLRINAYGHSDILNKGRGTESIHKKNVAVYKSAP